MFRGPVPKHAQCVHDVAITMPTGRVVRALTYTGYGSQGYKSNFESVRQSWFILIENRKRLAGWSYSGKREPLAEVHFGKLLADATSEGATIEDSDWLARATARRLLELSVVS